MAGCEKCKKSPPEVDNLKKCAKCSVTQYCSRDCQKADWKSHKKTCGKTGQGAAPGSSNTNTAGGGTLNPPKGLDGPITKPFTRLDNGTWLHDRPEKDVYRLLIDTYRMRMEDDYKFDGQADADGLYAGGPSAAPGFRRFLEKMETNNRFLLPSWWEASHKEACVAFGVRGNDGWSSLGAQITKGDVIDHYGDPQFPMQLRMFAELIYKRGPRGSDGTAMRKMQASLENGGGDMFGGSHVSMLGMDMAGGRRHTTHHDFTRGQ